MTLNPSLRAVPVGDGSNQAALTGAGSTCGVVHRPGTAITPQLPDPTTAFADFDLPSCTYVQCRRCQAPMVSPFPDDWILDLFKVGEPQGPSDTYVMPHRPNCSAPEPDMAPETGIGLRLPGRAVAQVWPAHR